MKIALVHDDLVQWGGAEKVLWEISEMFPKAPIYTSVFDQNNSLITEKFGNKKIMTSFLQKIPGWRGLYRPMLPLYPLAFESFDFSEFDLVISQTTKFAKAIITTPKTKHICLIHTPPRFLWHLPSDRSSVLLSPVFSYLRWYDQISARRVDYYLAGSLNCQQRLRKVYQVDSTVLYPFVDETLKPKTEPFNGGYYLLIARLNEYKNAQLYYDLGFFKAAGVAFSVLMDDFPDSESGDTYAFSSIKSYYRYAEMSIVDKQEERFGQVISQVENFNVRFPDSKLLADANDYKTQSENNLKKLQIQNNEQTQATTQR